MLTEKSCGAVVCYGSNSELLYLLLHYEAGHWDLVKGNVEKGETEQETALRELKEETGISGAQFVDSFRQSINYFYRRNGSVVQKEVIFFLIKTLTNNVELSFEHVGFVWLPLDQAIEKLTFKNAKEVLKKADDFLKKKEK
ncbi:MAG: NUDIX domain-containing protein [Crenarchaeota archaeon]|nr:NUDIX domain-containing protein [Thermoproteota archaeon]